MLKGLGRTLRASYGWTGAGLWVMLSLVKRPLLRSQPMKNFTSTQSPRLVRWACAAMLFPALALPAFSSDPETTSKGRAPAKLNLQSTPLDRESKAPISYAPIVKRVAPSVVTIYSTVTVRQRSGLGPFLDDPILRRFFGDDSGQPGPSRSRREQSLGSGVIVSSDGYILTANHVVQGAESVKVALAAGDKEFKATVIGADPPTDIAVLKIESNKPLPAVAIADSDRLEVGDVVLAVGNPFSVGQTVTLGIISALGRGGLGIAGYEDFIQTDAAINPGNSGGALVDAQGRLVGINTAILSRSGGFQGVSFAVPINMGRYVMERLIATGKVARGYLGVSIQPLTPELAKEFDLPDESSGALVGEVTSKSAAAKAGIKDGDVIVELNGKKVTDPRSLRLLVAQGLPGTKVTLKVLRSEGGHKPAEKTLSATLAELPEEFSIGQSRSREDEGRQPAADLLDGVEVGDLDPAARRELGVPRQMRGALVTNVEAGSTAAEAGLRPMDVIVEINRQPVRSADEAIALSEKVSGDRVLLRVWSRTANGVGGMRYIVVENAKHK
jgi:serine protease Do